MQWQVQGAEEREGSVDTAQEGDQAPGVVVAGGGQSISIFILSCQKSAGVVAGEDGD